MAAPPRPPQRRNLPLLATPEHVSCGTFIVTGANTGLGYEAAKHLVALGASKVILGIRNLVAGETARANIAKETGKTDTAEVWELDLANYTSVKAFANKVVTNLDRIDAFIENAAVAGLLGKGEGHPLCLTVNVYSTLLLAALLFPKLQGSAQKFDIIPRMTIVTSDSSFNVQEPWNQIKDDPLVKMDEDTFGQGTYPLSKLLVLLASRQLASLLPVSRTGVIINMVNPGICKTELSRNAPPDFRKHLAELHATIGRTAEDGSRTLLHGAVGGKDTHGRHLDSCEIDDDKLPSWITDEEGKKTQELVWNLIAKELELICPGSVANMLQV